MIDCAKVHDMNERKVMLAELALASHALFLPPTGEVQPLNHTTINM